MKSRFLAGKSTATAEQAQHEAHLAGSRASTWCPDVCKPVDPKPQSTQCHIIPIVLNVHFMASSGGGGHGGWFGRRLVFPSIRFLSSSCPSGVALTGVVTGFDRGPVVDPPASQVSGIEDSARERERERERVRGTTWAPERGRWKMREKEKRVTNDVMNPCFANHYG
ncbi:hypothetical protein LZ30DRAFT_426292 [Colletotrichum cereale]|nr:hypothetical protein LZ30DRAFT_426292 [Colletotrichum cereale]